MNMDCVCVVNAKIFRRDKFSDDSKSCTKNFLTNFRPRAYHTENFALNAIKINVQHNVL